MINTDKQHAHALLDRMPDAQLSTAVRFLEFLLLSPTQLAPASTPPEDEQPSEEEEQATARSKEWFKTHDGIPFEQVVADLGFTMKQIREASGETAL